MSTNTVIFRRLVFCIVAAFQCCNYTRESGDKHRVDAPPSPGSTTASAIPVFDTTVHLSGINNSHYEGASITFFLAKQVLYRYFKGKGYYAPDDTVAEALAANDAEIVSYDTLFLADINGDNRVDGIITYRLMPAGASGHCWQPHSALIVDGNDGYQICNEEFIPPEFSIDSVSRQSGRLVVFGSDYDCADNVVRRTFRATLLK